MGGTPTWSFHGEGDDLQWNYVFWMILIPIFSDSANTCERTSGFILPPNTRPRTSAWLSGTLQQHDLKTSLIVELLAQLTCYFLGIVQECLKDGWKHLERREDHDLEVPKVVRSGLGTHWMGLLYSLVNYKKLLKIAICSCFIRLKWWYSIVMLVYQRVIIFNPWVLFLLMLLCTNRPSKYRYHQATISLPPCAPSSASWLIESYRPHEVSS